MHQSGRVRADHCIALSGFISRRKRRRVNKQSSPMINEREENDEFVRGRLSSVSLDFDRLLIGGSTFRAKFG